MTKICTPILLFILLLVSLTTFIGIIGFGMNPHFHNIDQKILYTSGELWREGINPYINYNERIKSGIAYPPQEASIFSPLSLIDLEKELILWKIINILCILIIAHKIRNLLEGNDAIVISGYTLATALSICVALNSHIYTVLWMGQTSIVVLTLLLVAWELKNKNGVIENIVAGILFSLAAIKPQLSFLPLVWVVLEQKWIAISSFVISTGCLIIYPLILQGFRVFPDWINSLSSYSKLSFTNHVIGLQSLLKTIGYNNQTVSADNLSLILGAVVITFIWRKKESIEKEYILPILLGVSTIFLGHIHGYDAIIIIPLQAVLFLYTMENKKLIPITTLLLIMIMAPHIKIIESRSTSIDIRTIGIMGTLLIVIYQSIKSLKKITDNHKNDIKKMEI